MPKRVYLLKTCWNVEGICKEKVKKDWTNYAQKACKKGIQFVSIINLSGNQNHLS